MVSLRAAKLAVVNIAGDPATTNTGAVAPVVGVVVLGAPGPHDPAGAALVRAALSAERASKLLLVLVGPVVRVARLALARANVLATGELAVVASTLEAAVQVRGTVGKRGRPLADNLVKVLRRLGKAVAETAPVVNALTKRLRDRVVVKDRVDVRVDHHVLEAGRVHLAAPVVVGGGVLESIANDDHKGSVLVASRVAHRLVRALVEGVHLVTVASGLVHERDTSDVRVLVLAKLFRKSREDVTSALLILVVAEPVGLVDTAAVVVAVSVTRHTVQLNHHVKIVLASPVCGLLELVVLVNLDVGVVTVSTDTPVRERNTDVVETVRLDLLKVVLSNEVVDVVAEDALSLATRGVVAERPLVNDTVIIGLLVDTRSNERFDHEPATKADTANLLAAIVEAEIGHISAALENSIAVDARLRKVVVGAHERGNDRQK